MHFLSYVAVLSLPIFHVVPFIFSAAQSFFWDTEQAAASLISTSDLSDEVLCLFKWLLSTSQGAV